MLRYIRRSLTLLMLLWLTACGTAQPPAHLADPVVYRGAPIGAPRTDFTAYRDARYPFELWLPREWYMGQLESTTYGIVVTSDDDPARARVAISVLVEPSRGPVDLTRAITAAEETLRGQQGIDTWETVLARSATVNGVAGEERLYSYQLDHTPIRQRTVYVRGQDQFYALSLIAPQELYAQHEALFSDVLASFKGA